MPEYHFYMIKPDGHVDGPWTGHLLPNDLTAIHEAKQLVDGHDIEIWQGPRLVAYVVPDERMKLQ